MLKGVSRGVPCPNPPGPPVSQPGCVDTAGLLQGQGRCRSGKSHLRCLWQGWAWSRGPTRGWSRHDCSGGRAAGWTERSGLGSASWPDSGFVLLEKGLFLQTPSKSVLIHQKRS